MTQNPSEGGPELRQGISPLLVIVGGIVLLAGLTFAVYVLGSELGNSSNLSNFAPALNSLKQQVVDRIESSLPREQPQTTRSTADTTSAKRKEESAYDRAATYDIGAYLTYGGQAFTLASAVAKLSSDRKRLIVGLFEDGQPQREKPAMGMIFEFKSVLDSCKISNVKELAIIFNLRAMGNIAAQQAQVIKRSAEEIRLALTGFECDLRKGGRLDLDSLGSDPNLLKPRGSTFGWGIRLAQEIS